ncbi:glycosyltransferase family 2 protein [Patescibacteria group bacterium]
MKIFVAIPAYNEKTKIKTVVGDVKKEGYQNVLVVDDGSSDDTFEMAQKAGATTIKHLINRGKGAATKTALKGALALGAEIVVTIDGDGQHDPKDISRAIQPLLDKKIDVVLGSRFKSKNKIPFLRRFYNWIGNLVTFALGGVFVSDSQSGFRAYSKKALGLIDTRGDRYEFESEIIHEISQNKLSFTEVPVKVRYTKYSMTKGQGLKNGIKTFLRLFLKKIV